MSVTPRLVTMFGAAVILAACTLGPDYQRPPAPVPAHYKEDGWKVGEPGDAANRGDWWAVYNDTVLDGLERQIDVSNQNLKAAEAAYRQARAVVSEARAGYFPTVTATGSATRAGAGGRGTINVRGGGGGQTEYNLTGSASWDLDVWGRIRRTVESDVASAQASAADLASARLSAQSLLATDYFLLRAADEQKRILDASVVAFSEALKITNNQYNAGVAGAADVAQARTQLENTQAQSVAVGIQRASLEHAIAVLVGKPPADVAIEPAPLTSIVPVIPAGVPSTLLERRPDIATAERQMAATNAQIGVAEAAFYPDITLSASYGYDAFNLGKLLETANRVWSVGPQLTQTIFDAGLRSAQLDAARASYDQSVANYRQVVLTGFQQVEDQLAALRILAEQSTLQESAVRNAREAERLILNQYLAGTVAYTSVIIAQTTRLNDEEAALTVLQNRLTASVALIQAMGGGWDAAQLPNTAQVEEGGFLAPSH
ncbi:MAG TPA: efflux transporter outer membrane subunit [Stellaceae bacterium]|nr:efflux transporter outer membrane subunit [Stellaceae bacterium]